MYSGQFFEGLFLKMEDTDGHCAAGNSMDMPDEEILADSKNCDEQDEVSSLLSPDWLMNAVTVRPGRRMIAVRNKNTAIRIPVMNIADTIHGGIVSVKVFF